MQMRAFARIGSSLFVGSILIKPIQANTLSILRIFYATNIKKFEKSAKFFSRFFKMIIKKNHI